ncbi:HlyC/CorC family transporter [Wenzhouxiangella marina]|uniref:Magnesium and cobalt efflux protein CorC n=1 Tax=Wenzhouxiangella marina TaxID=1579979 RepID=A0A0K0XXS1_9GAMM|nr:HlyC/CorC family transporter [Wenzhouxiangella marina]AKS42432.1 Membrane protein [Wenzhouxiangella marina]MBB6085794.1 Mg2+/Co2+ transporter CorB [Wenzhouxiangella marina]
MSELPLSALFALLGLLIVLSAFFSSSETGLVALNRYRLRHQADGGHRGARLAQALLGQPDRMFGLILLGNNLVNILAASIGTVIAIRLFGEAGIWISTLVLTAVVLIFAELAPKTVAALHPDRIAYPASYILTPLLKLLYPVVWVINLAASGLLRPFGIRRGTGHSDALSREELRSLVKEGGGRHISMDHQQMLINILDLEHGRVDDVMVPRQDIVGLDLDADWDEIVQTLTQSLFTRLPVWRGDLDNIVGLLHIRTVVTQLAQNRLDMASLMRAIRKPYFIPEGTALTQQLLEFQSRERRMGLVVDEYGDIQGLVTLDDILEEIVGEYTTEGGSRQRRVRQQENGTWIIDGAATVRMLNRRLDWDLPTSGAKTINGLLLEELESIPEGRTSLRIGEQLFTIVDLDGSRIRKVMVRSAED